MILPINLSLYGEDGSWTCEYKEFSSLSFGPTPTQAVQSFFEDFSVLWDEIAEAKDDALAPDARRIKQALLAAVKEVQPERARCR